MAKPITPTDDYVTTDKFYQTLCIVKDDVKILDRKVSNIDERLISLENKVDDNHKEVNAKIDMINNKLDKLLNGKA